ncbi:MAG: Asp-tRNA(Asn)/Glu-tRNA(Gln) amidotransferase GatCAB subunit B, partial [Pseudomonadota bacterium]
ELPDDKKARFVTAYGVTEYDASVLTAERENADFFEAAAAGRDGKQAANWVINELFGRLNKEGLCVAQSPISPTQIGGVIDLIKSGDISGKIAKDLFEILWTDGGDPAEVVEARGMKQVTDTGAIETAMDQVIAANPDKVAQAQEKPSLAGWFVGQVMKATGGKANPKAVNEIVRAKLGI